MKKRIDAVLYRCGLVTGRHAELYECHSKSHYLSVFFIQWFFLGSEGSLQAALANAVDFIIIMCV